MDSVGFWNIRGINSLNKHGDVRWFITHHSCGLFGFLETILKAGNFYEVFFLEFVNNEA